MHHPALAERVGDLGEYLRFDSRVPGDVRELAILITARSVSQAYEWVAHAPIGRKAGVVLAGYSRLIAGVLLSFDVPRPAGTAPPF